MSDGGHLLEVRNVRKQFGGVAALNGLDLHVDPGEIDRRLYPNFAKLATASDWYRNATATIGMTGWALPSILSGRYPAEDRLPIASQFPDNLFTLLGNSYHYKMHVFEGMSQLCPPATCPDAKRSSGGTALGGNDAGSGGGFRGVLRDSATVFSQIVSTHDAAQDPTATLEEATEDAAAGVQGFLDRRKES